MLSLSGYTQPPCGVPPCGGGGGGGPGCFPPPCVPIDQGIWALFLVGALYGLYQVRKTNQLITPKGDNI